MSFSNLLRGAAMVAAMLAGFQSVTGQEPATFSADALLEYVRQPDPAYAWRVVKRLKSDEATTYVVHLTSQSWRTQDDVDRTVWEHWLLVVRPETVAYEKAFLLIGGGSNNSGPPSSANDITLRIAHANKSVVAELKMVPNEPITFHGDGVARKEDDLIGYAWAQFLETGNATWLPRLPMVKGAVRAMDCIQELMASEAGGKLPIEGFVVAGGSKRGWTTWMT